MKLLTNVLVFIVLWTALIVVFTETMAFLGVNSL